MGQESGPWDLAQQQSLLGEGSEIWCPGPGFLKTKEGGTRCACAGWHTAAALQFERSKNGEELEGHHEENPAGGQAQLRGPQFPHLSNGAASSSHLC